MKTSWQFILARGLRSRRAKRNVASSEAEVKTYLQNATTTESFGIFILECDMEAFITSMAGVRIPRIIYGTAWKKTDTRRLVEIAIREGFRAIDTACQPKHYDEAGVGAGVTACLNLGLARRDLYLQTKFTPVSGQNPRQIPYNARASLPEQVAQSFAASLRNLQTDYLDCLILHSPLSTAEQTWALWHAFESLVDAGGVRQLGISNCYTLADIEHLCNGSRIKPAIVQNRFHAETGYDREIRGFCSQQGLLDPNGQPARPRARYHCCLGVDA
jgi:diketogulonate reductase-like aldo/keto reductase